MVCNFKPDLITNHCTVTTRLLQHYVHRIQAMTNLCQEQWLVLQTSTRCKIKCSIKSDENLVKFCSKQAVEHPLPLMKLPPKMSSRYQLACLDVLGNQTSDETDTTFLFVQVRLAQRKTPDDSSRQEMLWHRMLIHL